MNYKFLKYFYIASTVLVILALFPVSTLAVSVAEIRFDWEAGEVYSGDEFLVHIVLQAEESVNAVEGKILFPSDALRVKEIRDGNSVINFWVERPRLEAPGVVIFSGITPGGFRGENNKIFSIVFEAKKSGTASVGFQDGKVFRNDGEGSVIMLTAKDLIINIVSESDERSGGKKISSGKITDIDEPEVFTPIVASDPSIFGGRKFVVFETQDKGSGIKGYEIKESRSTTLSFLNIWKTAKSPYLLRDQELKSRIYIKAVDNSGNERIVEIKPVHAPLWYENTEYWFIMIIIAILLFFGIKLWRRKNI